MAYDCLAVCSEKVSETSVICDVGSDTDTPVSGLSSYINLFCFWTFSLSIFFVMSSLAGSPRKGREGKGREGKGREGKGREGKGREGKGREGKGREGKE